MFAGKDTKVPFRNAKEFSEKYGGNPKDWQHVKGIGFITKDKEVIKKAEIHWSQCKEIGKVEMFIKRLIDES